MQHRGAPHLTFLDGLAVLKHNSMWCSKQCHQCYFWQHKAIVSVLTVIFSTHFTCQKQWMLRIPNMLLRLPWKAAVLTKGADGCHTSLHIIHIQLLGLLARAAMLPGHQAYLNTARSCQMSTMLSRFVENMKVQVWQFLNKVLCACCILCFTPSSKGGCQLCYTFRW